jgi:hypothetical protein
MKLTELLTRASADAPVYNVAFRQALDIVLAKWPHVRHFKDEQLQDLRAELRKAAA